MTFSDWFTINPELQDNEMLQIEEAHDIINKGIVGFSDEFLCKINKDYTDIIINNTCGEFLNM